MASIDTTSELGGLLQQRREEILAIAARHHGRRVRVFGSVARRQADDQSEVDFLVDFFEADSSLVDLQRLTEELARLLGRDVDVVSLGGLKPRDRTILSEAIDL